MKPIGKHLYSRLVILLAVFIMGTPEESIEFRLRVRPPGDAFFSEQI